MTDFETHPVGTDKRLRLQQAKLAKQRNEIARLSQANQRLVNERAALARDINALREALADSNNQRLKNENPPSHRCGMCGSEVWARDFSGAVICPDCDIEMRRITMQGFMT